MAQSEDATEIPALGRPFWLGMLYDCRNDALVPDLTLWDEDTIQKNLNTQPFASTESEIIASDSIDDKASALNISPSLQASFLGGLVDVRGSARYLQDTKKSKHQARVTLRYKTTTKYEQLTMSHLGIQNVSHPSVFERGTATHVVAAILYGAQAFFVFDREVSSSESVQEIEGNLQAMIEKFITITGEEEIKMDEREKSHSENFSCKFHGDFALESNPVNFQDAMQVYFTLPKMMGENGEKAVPMTVWLYPLTKLDSRAAKMMQEVSLEVISDCQRFIENLNEVSMRCNDLVKNPTVDTFSEIKRKIQKFQHLCEQHKHAFQKKMARILTSIRGGRKEEGVLVNFLTLIDQSLFNIQSLNEFLDSKEQEIKLVKSYLAILKEIEIISSQNKLEEIVLDPQSEFVISFTFTSLHDEEPFLSNFQHCLQKQFLQVANPTRGRSPLEKFKAWLEHEDILHNAWNAAKSILDFARVNKPNGKTRFVVASLPDRDNPGASIYLYKNGELISCNFELPQKPLPLLVSEIKHDSMKLVFQPATYGKGSISSYQIEYRTSGEENWKAMHTIDNREAVILEDLCPNTGYQFQYCARSMPGLSETSDINASGKTLPTSPPGKPREVTVGSSIISFTWGSPSIIGVGAIIKEYNVEYREESGHENSETKDQWNEIRTGRTKFCQISGLRPQTLYRIRVSAVCADGAQSAPSEEMEVSTSLEEEEKARLVHKYLQRSTLVVEGQPSIYVLPLEVRSDNSTSYLKSHLGEENLRVPNKVIMMMGETGSGKITLINGMVNYILGVQWEDKFRFKLLHEETNRSQAESQASDVKIYMLNYQQGFQIPYSLTIIDTPGFGDAGGIEHSITLTKEIRHFLSALQDIDHLDAICIVLQASLACLTPAQRYVFDYVLSILGKDMKDNIQVLVTFADGQTPPVLEAIKTAEVPCAEDANGIPVHFKFNNSALFANNTGGGSFNFDEMFWKMGSMSMKTFFDSSYTLESRSLTLTKEVLQEWKELEAAMEGLQPQIQAGLVLREELRKTQEVLNQHKDKMAANEHFEYEVEKTVPVKEGISGTGNYAINCRKCHFTCHYPCETNSEEERRSCAAINQNTGRCNVCPGQCTWNTHATQRYRFQYKVVKERKTYEELKERYEQASEDERATEKELRRLIEEYKEVRGGLEGLIQKSSHSLRRLKEIALRPSPLSAPEYIDLLIMAEQQELKPGHQERIESLKGMKNVAELIQKITHKEPLLPGEGDLYAKTESKRQPPPKPKFMKGMAAISSWFK